MSTTAQDNPFSTRFTRPGEIPYLFAGENDLGSLIQSFCRNRWIGQIVGPHGCGKTTLCHLMAKQLQHLFATVNHVTIRSGRDVHAMQMANSFGLPNRVSGPKLTIVDGVERLSLLQQWMLISNLTRKKEYNFHSEGFAHRVASDALLITSHRQLKLVPVLRSITPSLETFESVARVLDPTLQIGQNELAGLFGRANQNIREAIMLLYDRHEALRSSG